MSSGIGFFLRLALVVDGCLIGQQVGDADEPSAFIERELERRDAAAAELSTLLERAFEVGALRVELVDEDHSRDAVPGSERPEPLGLDLDAFDGRDDEHREVRYRQRKLGLGEEVR